MATLYLYSGFTCDPNSTTRIQAGYIDQPTTITLTNGNLIDKTVSVATATVTNLLLFGTSAGDDLASFSFVYITSTAASYIEFHGDAETSNSCIQIAANVPFILSTDNTTAADTTAALRLAATAKDIKSINIKQSSGSSATVRVVAGN